MTTKLSKSPVTRETSLQDGRKRDILVTLHEDDTISLRSKRCKEDWCRTPLQRLLPFAAEETEPANTAEPSEEIELIMARIQSKIMINPAVKAELKSIACRAVQEAYADYMSGDEPPVDAD